MTLIYFETHHYSSEQLHNLSKLLKEKLDDEVLFLPKDFHVMTDASVKQLTAAKNAIEAALEMKKQKENI